MKWIPVVFSVLLLSLLLSGCRSGGSSEETTPGSDETPQNTDQGQIGSSSNEEPSDWPGADNTGPKGELEIIYGGMTLTDGEILENAEVHGTVKWEGNVIIRNSRIYGGTYYGVQHTRRDVPGELLIEDTEITRFEGTGCGSAAMSYGPFTARRLNINGYSDGIKIHSNQTFEDSWIHDLCKSEGSHNDGIQSPGGKNIVIRGNNIEGPWQQSTSALMLGSVAGSRLENVTIIGNRLSGGSFTVYIGGKESTETPLNIVVRNNLFVGEDKYGAGVNAYNSWLYGPTSFRNGWPGDDPGAVWEDNLYSVGGNTVGTEVRAE